MEFDLIISNPPYGKIGANITKDIIDFVEYKEFINLLPANDYKRNETADLYNYQSDMEPINDGFAGDAAVTTHVARIHKSKVNTMTLDEFERSNYTDRQLDKYFEENSKRSSTTKTETTCLHSTKNYDVKTMVIIGWRDPAHKHMPYSKNCTSYKWNVEETIDFTYVVKNHLNKANGAVPFGGISFNTLEEKRNFINLLYSLNGFRFFSKIFTAIHMDMLNSFSKFMPKVDWTRSWTVEEILADYGYTEYEIKEVMKDLDRFKRMKD